MTPSHHVIIKHPRSPWKDLVRVILGWLFIVLGILGLFLPLLQGILFLAIGVWLLAPHIPLFHRLQQRLHARHPGLKKHIRRMHAREKLLRLRLSKSHRIPHPE